MSEPAVHIIDDDEPIRRALALLARAGGHRAEAYPDAAAFLGALTERTEGCVVTDVRMPGMSGLELQRALRGAGSPLPVIVITGHGDVAMAVQALRDGAYDFIEKPFDDDVFLTAVDGALRRGGRAAARRALISEIRRRWDSLTPRERQVMDLLVAGRGNSSIAETFGLSVRTVENHRARLMHKMGAAGFSDLVRMALALEPDGPPI